MSAPDPGRGLDPATRVLVVDDNVLAHRMAIRILEFGGYRGVTVASGEEARTALAEDPYRVALIDVRMPGESGIDLLRTVRAEYPQTAAIMVTASIDPETEKRAQELGARGYVVKPYRVDELLACIAAALESGTEEGGAAASSGEGS